MERVFELERGGGYRNFLPYKPAFQRMCLNEWLRSCDWPSRVARMQCPLLAQKMVPLVSRAQINLLPQVEGLGTASWDHGVLWGTSFWFSQLTARVWKLTALEAGSSENDWKAETWSFGSQMFLCWFSDVYSPTAEPQTFSFLNSFYCFGASDNDDSDAEPHDLYRCGQKWVLLDAFLYHSNTFLCFLFKRQL